MKLKSDIIKEFCEETGRESHTDLQVTISDPDAEFYESDDGETNILYHSRKTLGHEE